MTSLEMLVTETKKNSICLTDSDHDYTIYDIGRR